MSRGEKKGERGEKSLLCFCMLLILSPVSHNQALEAARIFAFLLLCLLITPKTTQTSSTSLTLPLLRFPGLYHWEQGTLTPVGLKVLLTSLLLVAFVCWYLGGASFSLLGFLLFWPLTWLSQSFNTDFCITLFLGTRILNTYHISNVT